MVPFRERSHPDVEVTQISHEPHQFVGVREPSGMLFPLTERIAGRVAAQRQDIRDAAIS